MQSGSMLIPNYLKEKTLLTISENIASSQPSDNALIEARAALNLERSSRSPNPGNISFLTEWIKIFTAQEKPVTEQMIFEEKIQEKVQETKEN